MYWSSVSYMRAASNVWFCVSNCWLNKYCEISGFTLRRKHCFPSSLHIISLISMYVCNLRSEFTAVRSSSWICENRGTKSLIGSFGLCLHKSRFVFSEDVSIVFPYMNRIFSINFGIVVIVSGLIVRDARPFSFWDMIASSNSGCWFWVWTVWVWRGPFLYREKGRVIGSGGLPREVVFWNWSYALLS